MNKRLEWAAVDASGVIRARFDSESEAMHYVQNRGHMDGGSYRKDNDEAGMLSVLRAFVTWEKSSLEGGKLRDPRLLASAMVKCHKAISRAEAMQERD